MLFRSCLAQTLLAFISLSTIIQSAAATGRLPEPNPQQSTTQQTDSQKKESQKKDEPVELRTHLVSLKVTVSDPYGRIVTGLRKEQFAVYDDRVKQEIAHFADADAPISVGIIFDVSGSMNGVVGASLDALKRFVETSHDDDDFFLIAFNDRAKLVEDFTTSGDKLLNKLTLVKPKGSTALYDAVYLGVEKVKQGRHSRRALLIISDGEDNHSRYSYSELRRQLKEADVQVYGIQIGGYLGYGGGVLSSIANLTGGRAFPTGGMSFMDICTTIALELRHQYSIGFYPTDARSPVKTHSVQVRVNAPRGLGRVSLAYRNQYESFQQ